MRFRTRVKRDKNSLSSLDLRNFWKLISFLSWFMRFCPLFLFLFSCEMHIFREKFTFFKEDVKTRAEWKLHCVAEWKLHCDIGMSEHFTVALGSVNMQKLRCQALQRRINNSICMCLDWINSTFCSVVQLDYFESLRDDDFELSHYLKETKQLTCRKVRQQRVKNRRLEFCWNILA